jgi:ankyrin repeat protein
VKEFGADVNQASNEGFTPIFGAAQEGHLLAVSCLGKELEADVKITSNDGYTPLLIAAKKGHASVVQTLVKELGADIHQGDSRGGTPLMAASHHTHADIVKWLVKAGANPNTSMDRWGTAADLSRKAGASTEQLGAVPAGALEGTQGRLLAVERGTEERWPKAMT